MTVPRKSLCYKAEPVGFEPTHPHGRRFSRPVQYQLCDGSRTGLLLVGSVCFARMELRSPTAILARLAVTSWTASAGHLFDARLEPAVLAPAYRRQPRARACEPANPGFERCDLSISIGAPGFEPGTSASRTQRSTGLSHAPNSTLTGQTRFCGNAWARTCVKRTVSSGWGGIRTHEGINPHDFQSCALSRSATHPVVGGGKGGARTESHHHHFTTSNGGSGIRTHADLRPTP